MLNVDDIAGLNIAFNEAILLGVELAPDQRIIAITISGVCMNADGTIPEDCRVQVILKPVGKLLASLRNSRWDDKNPPPIPFAAERLLETVQSFGGSPVYGWDFFDCGNNRYDRWKNKISLNYSSEPDGIQHTLDLFQDGSDRTLDMRIWFDEIKFFKPSIGEISMADFIQAGKKGWDAIMIDNDKKTQDTFAIYPSAVDNSEKKS